MFRIFEKKLSRIAWKLKHYIKWLDKFNHKQTKWITERAGSLLHNEWWTEALCDTAAQAAAEIWSYEVSKFHKFIQFFRWVGKRGQW
jgi:hypothetical protein